jgi:hypothetical protein
MLSFLFGIDDICKKGWRCIVPVGKLKQFYKISASHGAKMDK